MDCSRLKNRMKFEILDFDPKYCILGRNPNWKSKFSEKIQNLGPKSNFKKLRGNSLSAEIQWV